MRGKSLDSVAGEIIWLTAASFGPVFRIRQRRRPHAIDAPRIKVETRVLEVADRKDSFRNSVVVMFDRLTDDMVQLVSDNPAKRPPENRRFDLSPEHLKKPRTIDMKERQNAPIADGGIGQ